MPIVNSKLAKRMKEFGGTHQLCTPEAMQAILGSNIYTELMEQCKRDIEELKKQNRVS